MIKLLIAFFRGGTVGFSKPELLIFSSIFDALPKDQSDILRKQVKSVSLVQRHNPGQLLAAYYPKGLNVPLLPYVGYEYCLAKVSYRSNGTTKSTNAVLHDGKFMTFEGCVPRKNDHIDEILKVSLHPCDYKPVTQKIDVEEHGSNA